MDWLGHAKLSFHASPRSVIIKQKDSSKTTLLEICKEVVPPCHLNPLLFNGHLQTCWTAVSNWAPVVYYKRKIFEAEHSGYSGSYTVDFYTKDASEIKDESLPERTTYFTEEELQHLGSDDSRPMLVVLHGLSGGSHEVYLRHAIAPLLDSGKWEACVVNSRGCANSKITSGILYNARATWDTRQTVKWLKQRYPNRPLFGLGFSLGACILTNYLAEEGAGCQVKAAVVCANPWNLELSSKAMRRSVIGHNVYSKVLGSAMKRMAATHASEIQKYTDLDLDKLAGIKRLYEFDREIQCKAWGYPSENAYYRDASCVDTVMAIRVPFLALNSIDDPIAASEAIPFGEIEYNPYAVLCTTSLGGHLGWFETGGGRWHAKPVTNFMNHMAFKADLESIHAEANGGAKIYNAGAEFDPMRRRMYVPLD